MFVKDTGSFTYVLPSTCFPKNNIENIPKGVALRLRRICYSEEKFEKHSTEYQNYLIARDYKPGKMKKRFSDIKNLNREEVRKLKLLKTTFLLHAIWLHNITLCCLTLKTIIGNLLPILYSNQQMLNNTT